MPIPHARFTPDAATPARRWSPRFEEKSPLFPRKPLETQESRLLLFPLIGAYERLRALISAYQRLLPKAAAYGREARRCCRSRENGSLAA